VLKKALINARQLDCVVAFAKRSGLSRILNDLEALLAKGLVARFAVGLSFYQTEPRVLRKLLGLSKKHSAQAYVSATRSQATFHPKIYAIASGKGGKVLIGSANLTGGGLGANEEASALIDDPRNKLFQQVANYIDELIKDETLVELTEERLADYEVAYVIHERYRELLQRRIKRAATELGTKLVLLSDFLATMQEDQSDFGYAVQLKRRVKNATAAKSIIRKIGVSTPLGATAFRALLSALLDHFHSSGISRSKPKLVKGRRRLQESFAATCKLVSGDPSVTPEAAYGQLHSYFVGISGAGVNLLTEILHALDPHRFAVMNQNAVSGIGLAGFDGFPLHPLKSAVDGARYGEFCRKADIVRRDLKLPDFSALDALFNFVYWQENREDIDDSELGI